MIRTFTKRTLALVLTVVMLVSCWVFVAPTQSTAATAGDYYVEIDVYVKTAKTYNNTYAAPFFGTSTSSYKEMSGITVMYKENNGTADAGEDSNANHVYDDQKFENFGLGKNDVVTEKGNSSTKPNIAGNGGNHTLTATLTGFPTAFAVYNNLSGTGWLGSGWGEWSVKEIRVGASASSTLTTIWKGTCYTSNQDGGYPARWLVEQDGTVSCWDNDHMTIYQGKTGHDGGGAFYVWNKYYNGGDVNATLQEQADSTESNHDNQQMYTEGKKSGDDYKTGANANTYKQAWAMPHPVLSDISGASSVAVNTDGTTTNTESYAAGTVKDQYGVDWYQDATLTAETSNGVTFENGTLSVPATSNRASDYTATLTQTCGSATNSKTVTISTFDYNVNLYDEDGSTPLYSGIVDYSGSAVVATPTKAYDSTNHYTFNEWVGDSFTDITTGPQNRSANASYTAVAHTLGDPSIIITEPTCTEVGSGTATCTGCDYSDTVEIPALGHDYYDIYSAPTNGSAGSVCYGCDRCVKYFTATYDSTTNTYSPNATPVYNTLALAKRNAPANSKVSAPKFNSFYNQDINYNYAMRGASLKIAEPFEFTDSDTRQGLRFTASMHIPDGVSYTGEDNIVDFGFIYSQTNSEYVNNNINNLTLESVRSDRKIAKMSVADNNTEAGPFDGTNWTGVTAHADETLGGTTLTFNLLVNVKAYNWTSDYCARAYVTYNYHGHQYTVYDNQFSSRSVEYVARAVVDNPDETLKVRDFCQNKILTPIDEGWITPPNS